MNFEEIVKRTRAYNCLGCAVCTGSCPISRTSPGYSPRLTVRKAVFGFEKRVEEDPDLWSCLTCGTCSSRCPYDVDYVEFIKSIRMEVFQLGRHGLYSHNGLMQTIMEIMTQNPPQRRISWISQNLTTSSTSDYLYFVGCLPYFEIIFEDIGAKCLDIAKNAIKILNSVKINPIVSSQELCCGHDLLWSGDLESFKKLAGYNLKLIEKSGAKKVIFTCPECFHTIKEEYPKYFGPQKFQPIHISQFLSRLVEDDGIEFNQIKARMTYQDPCRLGRFEEIYEEPRKVINHIPGAKFIEMERDRSNSLCCGTTGWMNCDNCSKQIQKERLNQAKSTGAEILITGCPKCQIHLKCALSSLDMELEIKDITNLAGEALTVDL